MNIEDIKGLHGFINGAPAYPRNEWAGVDLFLHTWGFLPGDNTKLDLLSRENLTDLCSLALDAACRIDISGKNIKIIQGQMHSMGISPDSFKQQSNEQ